MNIPLRQNMLLTAFLSGVLLAFVYLSGTGLQAELDQFENLMRLIGGWLFIVLVTLAVSNNLIPVLPHRERVMLMIANGDVSQRVGFSGSDEFGKTGSSIDSTIDGLTQLIGLSTQTITTLQSKSGTIERENF